MKKKSDPIETASNWLYGMGILLLIINFIVGDQGSDITRVLSFVFPILYILLGYWLRKKPSKFSILGFAVLSIAHVSLQFFPLLLLWLVWGTYLIYQVYRVITSTKSDENANM